MVNFRSEFQRQNIVEHPRWSRHQKEWMAVTIGLTLIVTFLITLVVYERAHARAVERMASMSALGSMLNYYTMMNQRYPSGSGMIGVGDLRCFGKNGFASGARYDECKGLPWIAWLNPDPQSGYAYLYTSINNNTDFEVRFNLERSFIDLKAGQHRLTPRGIE